MGSQSYSRRRDRRGSAMLWALVILAMLTAILAAAAPLMMQANDLDRVVTSADMLGDVAKAVDSFTGGVRRGGASGPTPNGLTQLPTTVANGQPAGCSPQPYKGTAVTNWAASAPYGRFVIPTNGLWTPI